MTAPTSSPWYRIEKAKQDKSAVADLLQRAGVAAAPMNRAVDVLADSQVTFRKLFTDMTHPLFDALMPSETGPAPYLNIPPAEFRPAPMPGQHTREICHKCSPSTPRKPTG